MAFSLLFIDIVTLYLVQNFTAKVLNYDDIERRSGFM